MNELSLRAMFFVQNAITSIGDRIREERGQDMIEYAVFGGGLAILVIFAVTTLKVAGTNPFESIFKGISGCIDFKSSTTCSPLTLP